MNPIPVLAIAYIFVGFWTALCLQTRWAWSMSEDMLYQYKENPIPYYFCTNLVFIIIGAMWPLAWSCLGYMKLQKV